MVKTILFLSICFVGTTTQIARAQSSLRSPIKASLPGMSDVEDPQYLPNAHAVTRDGSLPTSLADDFSLVRGMMPFSDQPSAPNPHSNQIKFLKEKVGVTDVLIFKDLPDPRDGFAAENDVASVHELYRNAGYSDVAINYIPFPWKNIENRFEACEQTLQALRLIKKVEDEKHRLFLHCTVGEDRTGYLSALYRLLQRPDDLKNIWKNEMCERGYSSGNPHKPPFVVKATEDSLTPLFVRMYALIVTKKISWQKLDPSACLAQPKIEDVLSDPALGGLTIAQLKCEHSSQTNEARPLANPDPDARPSRTRKWKYESEKISDWN